VQGVSQAQVDSDAADLKSKNALVAQQQALVAKKIITAPFAGRLGITTTNPGQYLNPGDKIVTLQAIDPINPKVDTATRNVQLEATVANPKRQLLPGMFANATVDVGVKKHYLTLPQTAITYHPYGSTVFVVKPAAAKGDANAAPPKGDELEVQQAFVTTGETRGDQVAITSGLVEGQTVVTSGQIKLKNGTHIVVDNSVQPANNPNPTPQEH